MYNRPGSTRGQAAGVVLRAVVALVLLAGTLGLGGCFGGGGSVSDYGSIDGYVYCHADAKGSTAGEAAQQPEVIVSRLSTAPPGYAPLPRAKILAVQAGKWTCSNSQGYFILTPLSPGVYDVSITHETFINGLTYPGVRVVAGTTTPLGEAKLGSFFYLIIGINDYYPECANDLQFAVADADLLEFTLRDTNGYAGKVVKLTDQQATKAGILSAIEAIGDEMSPDGQDYFVMTFSGHGVSSVEPPPASGDPPYECLIASDGQYIYDYELAQWVRDNIPASVTGTRYCTFVFDSCRSGGMFKGVSGTGSSGADPAADGSRSFGSSLSRLARNLSAAGYVVITACDDVEVSYESPILGNGVFTKFFCEGLADGAADSNRDGLISAAEALSYAAPKVQEHLSAYPQEFGPNAVQTPQLFASPDNLRNVPIYRVR